MATTTKYSCDLCDATLEKPGEKVYMAWLGHLQTRAIKELCANCMEAMLGVPAEPEEETQDE